MLSGEHLNELANTMVLLDLLDKNKADSTETEELKLAHNELQEWADNVMKTLNEEEMKQVIERYTLERNSGNYKSLQ